MSSAFLPGRGSQVTPEERREIQCLRLVDGDSVSEIARKTSRNRETITNVLRADDTQALQYQLETEGRETALRELQAARHRAARAWDTAIQQAADKGDHRPAKDLLLHTGVIQPLEKSGPLVGVQVIVGKPADSGPIRSTQSRSLVTTNDERRESAAIRASSDMALQRGQPRRTLPKIQIPARESTRGPYRGALAQCPQ